MKDLTGQSFGRLVVVGFSHRNAQRYYWNCRCECGDVNEVRSDHLTAGKTVSCGCDRGTHKHSGADIYNTWEGMKQRCLNPKNPKFHMYGGRGVSICDRWMTFANFLADMGERPAGTTLDRIDNGVGYCPENCRWATRRDQQNNRRCNVVVTHEGKTMTATEWSRVTGIHARTIIDRFHAGITSDLILRKGRLPWRTKKTA